MQTQIRYLPSSALRTNSSLGISTFPVSAQGKSKSKTQLEKSVQGSTDYKWQPQSLEGLK